MKVRTTVEYEIDLPDTKTSEVVAAIKEHLPSSASVVAIAFAKEFGVSPQFKIGVPTVLYGGENKPRRASGDKKEKPAQEG